MDDPLVGGDQTEAVNSRGCHNRPVGRVPQRIAHGHNLGRNFGIDRDDLKRRSGFERKEKIVRWDA